MKRFYKLLVFVIVVSGAVIIFSGKAKAETVFTGASSSPTTARSICTTLDPVDFAAVVGDVRFDVTTGIITYDIGLGWRSCTGGEDTRAYAIYGPPEICPVSGWYGQNGTVTDCVKYIGNPAYQGDGNGLRCLWGQDAACVSNDGRSAIVPQQGPGGGLKNIDDMTYQVPNWPGAGQADGFHEFSRQMCQFYKTGANFGTSIGDSRCLTITIRVNWIFQNPPNNGECSAVMSGVSPVAPGETRNVVYTVRNTGGSNWGLIDPTEKHRLRNLDATIWGVPTDIDIEGPGVENNAVFGPILRTGISTSWGRDLTIPAGTPDGTYTFNWQIYGKGNDAATAVFIGSPCPLVVNVRDPATKPYFRVYGNDAMAGGVFADATIANPCSPTPSTFNSTATFQGYNAGGEVGGNNTSVNYLRGAGSQHALFALGAIKGVASSANRNYDSDNTNFGGSADRYPTRQTFANYISSYSGDYGGVSGLSRCIPDFYSRSSTVSAADTATNVYSLTVGNSDKSLLASPVANSLVNIVGDGATVKDGISQTVFINGDAKIGDGVNIRYRDDINSKNDIPNLTIVVKGDLYIDNDTTRLDGTYIVQPYWDGSAWKGGRLITCYDSGYDGGKGRPYDNTSLVTECNRKLEINGAVIAKEIRLLRTNGNYTSDPSSLVDGVEKPDSNNIAEVFNFIPEIYLRPTNFTSSSSTSKYDAINVLPPVF